VRIKVVVCQIAPQVTGLTRDGGYADYRVATADVLARIPDELSAVEAGPLMCAGITPRNYRESRFPRSGRRQGYLLFFP
jgi:D-arabinose 1-dehydrogenase-like Zn-dependent alcohol dehydrogenase